LANCSQEEIHNAYDNALLYTDYFLSKTIDLLKQNDVNFETVMFYLSDHGESLGENGIYLHGMPNFIAPDTQRHVPAMLWMGSKVEPELIEAIKVRKQQRHTQDSIFHMLFGYFGVQTSVYKPDLDIFKY
jgi:lipid A ethanolaminephosphotransferase